MEAKLFKRIVSASDRVRRDTEMLGLTPRYEVYNSLHAAEDNLTIEDRSSILFLSADPTDASRLRVGEELREIQDKLRMARVRSFSLHQRFSVRAEDLSQALLDVYPRIVHFAGHGTSTGELCIENKVGNILPVKPDALASLFKQFQNQVRCVVLNACYSEIQAIAIAQYIPYVIGTTDSIQDRGSIAFTIGFYQALGAGSTILDSYKFGCIQIALQGITDYSTPILMYKGNSIPL